ncbi:polyprenyl synthetase family protein [Thermus thermamylovorans]|uniref:Polyprenyl synthetase family protein n=1 Tax=Thermus thermamylovorans TaxID=2509362 RepID=A0A4Q9B3S3_9DEIN|nr:polyprenyl synthetase family protein [Thermus thermamylovorans]TBH20561.1 polyprenyl synthetase family protein [Thermus thermamylovorans]
MVPPPQETRKAIHERLLAQLSHPDPGYQALLQEYPSRGGKMLRGLLTVQAALAHGAPLEGALLVATAMELFQNWVLIHDDIEDASLERRGKPTLHRLHPMPLALNAGDALHGEMWGLLWRGVQEGLLEPAVLGEFYEVVRRTAYGQHLDLLWTLSGRLDLTPGDYLRMVEHKAAYYTAVAPLRLGALLAGREPPALYEEAGLKLGVAFQIMDDVLNLEGDEAYGKERAGDLYEGKPTLILIRFLQGASPEERERTGALLRLPREAKPEEEVRWLWERLLASGALAWAREEARRLMEEGRATLFPHLEGLPHPEAARALQSLLTALVERRA